MNNIAYLVIAVDKKTESICGCGIFSEEEPTTTINNVLFCPLAECGYTFSDAKENLLELLNAPYFEWYKKLYDRYNK